MSLEPDRVARLAIDSLPETLRESGVVRSIAYRIADEVIRYGHGVLDFGPSGKTEEGVVEMICEDIEATFLLSEYLGAEEEEAEELTPEERMKQILDKASKVRGELDSGLSLQEAIRRELADTDCGACDHPTCDLYSIALAKGTDDDNTKCEPGGPKVTAQVELVMEVGQGDDVDAEKILSIEAQAKDDDKREGGLRVLELATGRGSAGVVFAQMYPDTDFEILEPDLRRVWFLKRMVNLLGIRNCKLRVGRPEQMLDTLGANYDLVFVKHRSTADAVREAYPFTRPGGLIVNWQGEEWSDVAADYQRHGPGARLPLYHPRHFHSAPVENHVLLMVRRPEEASEEPEVSGEEATDSVVA